ncbi:MAG: methionyl-tRNA formyltransferase [Desulfatiglandaceae bacterium]
MNQNPVILFMGTPDYAVPSLEGLVNKGYTVGAVVTQPDRPRGRKRRPVPPPVKTAALTLGLEVLQPEKASDGAFLTRVQQMNPDVIVVVAFGQILKRAFLHIPRWGALNIHASLLPKYRGAAPIQWAIINDEKKTGLTTMRMDEGLDTGPILLQEVCSVGPEETAGELHHRLSILSGELLLKTLEQLKAGLLTETVQAHDRATYAPKIDRHLSAINWENSARKLSALIRGLDPWPGAVTEIQGKGVKLFSPWIMDETRTGLKPGRVVGHSEHGLMVETGKGVIGIREVQAPGKRRLPAGDFLRGFPIAEGTVFG